MENIHKTYIQSFKHPPDFRVEYRFYEEAEGGRKNPPIQGYRSDFWYYHELQPNPNSIYLIYPEFEDVNGNIITDRNQDISRTGTASMWIINSPMRAMHRDRIVVGLKGFFKEGPTSVAECRVIEIVGLLENPVDKMQ